MEKMVGELTKKVGDITEKVGVYTANLIQSINHVTPAFTRNSTIMNSNHATIHC